MAKQFFLLGKNASKYSFSPSYFGEKFKELELTKHEYTSLDLESIDLLPSALADFPNLVGFNVTIPYKTDIISYLDELDSAVQKIGAVNTVKRLENGKLIGYNTDYIGFWNALKPHLSPVQKKSKALILGTGGASKAVMYAFEQNQIPYTLVSRSPSVNTLTYEQLTTEVLAEHLIVVNTTPLGTFPEVERRPNIPYSFLTESHLGYDLVYNPAQTAFMHGFLEKNGKALNGYQMLLGQAEKSWEIWTA